MLNDQEFEDRYGPFIESPEGSELWDASRYWEVVNKAKQGEYQVWSVLEGEGGTLYAMPGYHVVNMVGYLIGEKHCEDINFQAVYY